MPKVLDRGHQFTIYDEESSMLTKVIQMLDFRDPEHVEVIIDRERNRLWVNIEGVCRLRVQAAKALTVSDSEHP